MEHISNEVFIYLTLQGLLAVLIPVVILIVWKRKTKCKLMPALVGAITFIVFAMGLESIPKLIFLNGTTELSKYIMGNAWLYTFLGCLFAGVFEEGGRFVAFKFFLKKHNTRETAITYGIGHGGIESILIMGITTVSMIILGITANSGNMDTLMKTYTAEQAQTVTDQVNALAGMGIGNAALGVMERVCAITLHISLSIVVFMGVKQKGKGWLVWLAILLHAVFDVPAALCQVGVIGMPVCEALLAVTAVIIAIAAYKLYHRFEK